jgi:hypothetical protein
MNARRGLWNFFISNLFAVFPLLWVLFGWMPDQVIIRMRGWEEAPGAIIANGAALAGKEDGAWKGGRIFQFYLQSGMKWNDLVFRFPGEAGADAVERVELQKWKLLSFCKKGRTLLERDAGTAEYVFPNPRFDFVGWAGSKECWGVVGLEVLLAILSFCCARSPSKEKWKTLFLPAVSVVLALLLLTHVALPIQSFWANRASYPFTFGALVGALAWPFAWMSVLGIIGMTLLARCFGRWVFGVMLALAVCVYLEAGLLSAGLANLNGDVFLLQNRTRALWDAAVWGGVFAAILSAHPVLRRHYVLASLCLTVMVGASLLDTKHEKMPDKSNLLIHDFMPVDTVIRSVTYSTNRNVMVFIIDSLEREQAHAIMEDPEAGPKLREQFHGFIEYTNNVGALPQTLLAVPNLLTGCYPDGSTSIADYVWSCYGPGSVLADYLETGHEAFMTTPALGCGYSTRVEGTNVLSGRTASVLDCSGNGGGGWSIRNFVRWRSVPFVAKASVSFHTSIANGAADFREWALFPELAQASVDSGSSGIFFLVHTEGVHVPVQWNRRGEMLPSGDDSDRGIVEQGVFVMNQLSKLMDSFREKGIYDNSLILVLGDHGEHQEAKFRQDMLAGHLPRNARPCLWVKPMGSSHDFRADAHPTSLARVAELLRTAGRNVLSEEDIGSILQSDNRIYRRMAVLEGGWTDWIVAQDGSFKIEEHERGLAAQTVPRPLQCGRNYPLFWQNLKDFDADFSCRNLVGRNGYFVWLKESPDAAFEFRVPAAAGRYVLRIRVNPTDVVGGSLRARSDTPGAQWQVFPVRPHGEVDVHGVVADSSGIARVVFERASEPDVDVSFLSLLLEEE